MFSLRYCTDVAQWKSTKLWPILGRLLRWCTIYIFGGSYPVTESCQVQNSGWLSRWASAHILVILRRLTVCFACLVFSFHTRHIGGQISWSQHLTKIRKMLLKTWSSIQHLTSTAVRWRDWIPSLSVTRTRQAELIWPLLMPKVASFCDHLSYCWALVICD